MFEKILIANRGEIAVRIIRACQALGIKSVAVYSDADTQALHVRLADEAFHIGAAPSAESYLQGEKIIQVALEQACQAIHPGYGFLSENAAFAEAVQAAGLVFIGPAPAAIRQMGSKTEARHLMIKAGVPVVPGFQGDIHDFPMEAQKIGYPVLVKAAAGGGGKGMRVVHDPHDLAEALEAAQTEAAKAFGDGTVFLEKYLPVSHHIEFQILADSQGHVLHLFERECSIQRRHQKIIEETPSPLLSPQTRAEMGAAAVAAAKSVGYVNAGTIEFIVDEDENFYFLEMNTRLQVEHPITECVTGLDLVQWQLRIAAGESLAFTQNDLSQRGHAIECRIYAEDPANDFMPVVGQVLRLNAPFMPNIRLDSGVETGDQVSVHYDPMIAKLIAYGTDRQQAIQTMLAALHHFVLLGLTTNQAFLAEVLQHPDFQAGKTPTHFIPTHFSHWQAPELNDFEWQAALIAAAFQEMNHKALPTPSLSPSYSPWDKQDRFRIG